MAGSLLRLPLNIKSLTKCNKKSNFNTNNNSNNNRIRAATLVKRAEYKFLIKKYQKRQRSLCLNEGQQSNCRQLQHLLQQQQKYYRQQSLFKKKLLLLLFATTNDCCWTAIEQRNDCRNSLASTKIWTINYEQQQQQYHQQKQQQQHQQYLFHQQQQLFQLGNNKVLATTKKFRKNLLNRKKVQKLQLHLTEEFFFNRKQQLLRNFNLF